jgi:hypothetical protein
MEDDRRKAERLDSHNLLHYVCLDENGIGISQGMGRTRNISEGGILMETHLPIDPRRTVSLTMAIENGAFEIQGKVVYSRKREEGGYDTGIDLFEMNQAQHQFLRQFLVLTRNP